RFHQIHGQRSVDRRQQAVEDFVGGGRNHGDSTLETRTKNFELRTNVALRHWTTATNNPRRSSTPTSGWWSTTQNRWRRNRRDVRTVDAPSVLDPSSSPSLLGGNRTS